MSLIITACGSSSESSADSCSACGTCDEGFELVECEDDCICESSDSAVQVLKQDYLDVLACDSVEPCPRSNFSGDPYPGYWNGGECLLGGLRDRRPGAYHFDTYYGDQGFGSELTLLVSDDGGVTIASTNSVRHFEGPAHRSYSPAQSCTLQSPEFFEACLEAGTDVSATATTGGGGAGATTPMPCNKPAMWYSDCVPAEPACPE